MEEIDIKELISLFWNKKVEIIIITIIFLIIGSVYSFRMVTPKYKSSTTLVLAMVDNNSEKANAITQTEITINSKLVSTYSELVKSNVILREVIDKVQIEGLTESSLRKSIKVSSIKDTEIIKIEVEDENSVTAARVSNEVASVFAIKVAEIYNINNVFIVDKAEASTIPSNINHLKDIAIFMAIGIILGFAEVLLFKLLDNKIRTAKDIERETKLLVLASIPKNIDSRKRRLL